MTERKKILLRLDPVVHDAIARWAGDELRSTNAQIEFLLRSALAAAGRLPTGVGRLPMRGRPPRSRPETETGASPPTAGGGADAAEDSGGSADAGTENSTATAAEGDGTGDSGGGGTAGPARPTDPD